VRIESSVTSISWIPSEAMTGPLRLPVDMGIGHYDVPPPDRCDDLVELRDGDRFRFANHLKAFVEVVDGKVIQAGYLGGGLIGSTVIKMGTRSVTIPAVSYTDIRRDPEITESGVRFVQTAGGRTGAPLPRRISRPPFVQITAPTAWTTLSLTIGVDGSSSFELLGASPFPRHWIYGEDGALALKSGVIDFAEWAAKNTHDRSPWFDHDQTSPVSEVESPAERAMSVEIMGGETPALRRYQTGDPLMTQGTPGREVLLILDGMTEISIDGEAVAEAGPGSILGERAALEGGLRTATVTATTPVRVAVTEAHELDLNDLAEVARLHRREEG
jgi:hypothetical protein